MEGGDESMGARARAMVAAVMVAGVLGGAVGAYAATGGAKAKSHPNHMNGTKSSKNCPNM
jgi:hypothetical protein